MGEAIITSRSAAQEEAVPVVPGYHSILATVRDYQGKLLKDYPINCKDGSVWYNYKTNETGKVLFTCNSGAANISINNVIDGYRYLDFPNHIINCDCPIGGQTRLAFNIPKTTTTNFSFGAGSSLVRFLHDQECSGYIVGGGGGGTAATSSQLRATHQIGGSGGGGGYTAEFNNYKFYLNNNYNIIVGYGGRGGIRSTYRGGDRGNAGGSSAISNTNIIANGGSGGQQSVNNIAYTDGSGKGGCMGNNGTDSNSSLGGGGGGGQSYSWGTYYNGVPYMINKYTYGGKPYGGNGGGCSWDTYWMNINNSVRPEDGKGPGGGGGAGASDWMSYTDDTNNGGNGAAGICKLNMVNY